MPTDTLLLPARDRFAGVPQGPLGRALGRADRLAADEDAEAFLAGRFEILPRGWPAAAATRARDVGDAGDGLWLRADPAYVRPDINGARLLAHGPALGLDERDRDALLSALQPVFGDAGMALDAPTADRWYLRMQPGASLPTFVTPAQALGADVFDHLPGASETGPEARRWRALSNEAQVVLHNHPHNARRLESGRVPVNSLWFWGAGVLPREVRSTVEVFYGADDAVDAFARLAGATCQPLPAAWSAGEGARLFDLRPLREQERLLADWLEPAAAARDRTVEFRFADGGGYRLAPGHRWRFWRAAARSLG